MERMRIVPNNLEAINAALSEGYAIVSRYGGTCDVYLDQEYPDHAFIVIRLSFKKWFELDEKDKAYEKVKNFPKGGISWKDLNDH